MCNYIMSTNFIIQCPVCLIQFTTREERKEHFEMQHVVG
jgi:hypothetical protein